MVAVILDFRLQKNNKHTNKTKQNTPKKTTQQKTINNTDYDQTI